MIRKGKSNILLFNFITLDSDVIFYHVKINWNIIFENYLYILFLTLETIKLEILRWNSEVRSHVFHWISVIILYIYSRTSLFIYRRGESTGRYSLLKMRFIWTFWHSWLPLCKKHTVHVEHTGHITLREVTVTLIHGVVVYFIERNTTIVCFCIDEYI